MSMMKGQVIEGTVETSNGFEITVNFNADALVDPYPSNPYPSNHVGIGMVYNENNGKIGKFLGFSFGVGVTLEARNPIPIRLS